MAALREDAEAVWRAAFAAVAPDRLVARRWTVEGHQLFEDHAPLDPPVRFDRAKRIVVVGGGKAAAGLAAGLEELLPAELPVSGLIGVPAGCGLALPRLEVREVRPVGRNEPTEACVTATHEMLAMLADLTHDDMAFAVVTGGGSAILTAPLPGIPLEEITACTRWLSEHGATIGELNQVRQAISSVKAGGLARRCRAGRLVVLVISDVIGDPLETISSGPCMPVAIDPAAALATLERFSLPKAGIAPTIVAHLQTSAATGFADHAQATPAAPDGRWRTPSGCEVSHHLLASNTTALRAAADQAVRLGYRIRLRPADPAAHETAEEVGRRLTAEGRAALRSAGQQRLAILEGGEATVDLPVEHGIGGRNQQSVAAGLNWLVSREPWPPGLLLASVGTDGEDGPTDAAGGVATDAVAAAIAAQGLSPANAVHRCDAFPLLRSSGGLVHTGPTGTNVADLRIVLVDGLTGGA